MPGPRKSGLSHVRGWLMNPRGRVTSSPSSWSGARRSFPTATAQRIRKRDHGQCANCGSTEQTQVDHIVPHAEATRMGWTQDMIDDESNGQLLCHGCHEAKTRGERASGLARAKARRERPQRRHPGLTG